MNRIKKLTLLSVLSILFFNLAIFAQNYYTPTQHEYENNYETSYISSEEDMATRTGLLVHFNPSGGTTLTGHEVAATQYGTAEAGHIGVDNMPSAPIPPAGSGFVFFGWSRVPGSVLAAHIFHGNSVVTAAESPLTVYAIWGHSVTFDGNGATLNFTPGGNPGSVAWHGPRIIPTNHSFAGTPGVVLPNASRDGYSFDGWFIGGNDAQPFDADSPVTSDLNLAALWTPLNRHTITFDPQGGILSNAIVGDRSHSLSRIAVHNTSIFTSSGIAILDNNSVAWPRSAPDVSRDNMTLEGWWTQPSGFSNNAGSRFAPQGGFNVAGTTIMGRPNGFATTVVTEDLTVYAHWVYRVTFNPNIGYMDYDAANAIYDAGYPNPRMYDADRNHFRDIVIPGGNVNDNGLLYNRISGTAHSVGMPDPSTMIRPGHVFVGWWSIPIHPYVPVGEEPSYAYEFFGDTPVSTSRTVYARWIPREHVSITFDLNSGNWSDGSNADYTVNVPTSGTIAHYSNAEMPPLWPEKDGYVFAGWFTDPQTGGDFDTRFRIDSIVQNDTRVYAHWRPAITVITDLNGGNISSAFFEPTRLFPTGRSFEQMHILFNERSIPNLQRRYDLVWMSNAGVNTRYNYQITGPISWNTTPDSVGLAVNPATIITQDIATNGVVTIYTRWNVTVIFNDNRAYPHGPGIGDNSILGVNIAGQPVSSHRTQVLLGRTFANNYLHPNTLGPGHPASPQFPMPGSHALDILDLTHTTWHMFGWNTQPDGSGNWYTADTVITGPTTLYAQWAESIVFHPGMAPSWVIPYQHRVSPFPFTPYAQLSAEHFYGPGWTPTPNPYINPPNWDGQVFLGWRNTRYGPGRIVDVNEPDFPVPPVAFARWQANLLFDATGGLITPLVGTPVPTWASSTEIGVPIGVVSMSQTPARSNWGFVQWNYHRWGLRENTGMTYTAATIATVSRDGINNRPSLYAQWETNVRFDLTTGQYITRTNVPEGGTITHARVSGGMPVNPPSIGEYDFSHWEVWDYNQGEYVTFSANTQVGNHLRFVDVAGVPHVDVIARYVGYEYEPGNKEEPPIYLPPPPWQPSLPSPTLPRQHAPTVSGYEDATSDIWHYTPDDPASLIPFSPYHHAYLIGNDHGLIRPNDSITRAEAATIFFRLISHEYRTKTWSQENPFPDVVLNHWFNNAVSTMANANIIFGMPSGMFEPDRAITRAEFAAAMTRFFVVAQFTGADMFPDIAGHWAEPEINTAVRAGWVTGFPDGTFMPDKNITRAEVAAIINRILKRLPETADDLLPGMIVWPDNADVTSWYYLYVQEATNSNEYVQKPDGVHKTWTKLIQPPDWVLLEREYSRPWDVLR